MKKIKIMKKIVITLVILTIILFSQGVVLYASSTGISSAGDILSAGQGFISKGKNGTPITMNDAQNLLPLGRILMAIALGIIVVVGMIMGVKYMISGADERANMKQKLIWYLIAAALVLAPVGIYNIVVKVMSAAGLS